VAVADCDAVRVCAAVKDGVGVLGGELVGVAVPNGVIVGEMVFEGVTDGVVVTLLVIEPESDCETVLVDEADHDGLMEGPDPEPT
jgi:hypothetical protein